MIDNGKILVRIYRTGFDEVAQLVFIEILFKGGGFLMMRIILADLLIQLLFYQFQ